MVRIDAIRFHVVECVKGAFQTNVARLAGIDVEAHANLTDCGNDGRQCQNTAFELVHNLGLSCRFDVVLKTKDNDVFNHI